jgi:uncharacterized protein (TIGR02118 family)
VTLTKVVCVVRGPLALDVPSVDGLVGYALVLPTTDVPPEHPDDVGGVASVWLEPDAPVDPRAWFPGAPVDAYRVEEHAQIQAARTTADGEPSPGLHRTVFVRRAPGITRDQMAQHWVDRHTPLVRKHHPGFHEYVQNVVVENVTSDAPEVDGISEMHFATLTDLEHRFYDSEAGRQVIAADVPRFLDRARGWRIIGREHWLVTPSTRSAPGR